MTIKERLREIYWQSRNIKHQEEQIEGLRSKVESPAYKPLSHDPIHSRDHSDKVGDMVAKLVDMTDMLASHIEHWKQDIWEMELLVQKLPAKHQQVIRLRYFENKKFAAIGDIMGYTTPRVHQLHGEALQRLEELQCSQRL